MLTTNEADDRNLDLLEDEFLPSPRAPRPVVRKHTDTWSQFA